MIRLSVLSAVTPDDRAKAQRTSLAQQQHQLADRLASAKQESGQAAETQEQELGQALEVSIVDWVMACVDGQHHGLDEPQSGGFQQSGADSSILSSQEALDLLASAATAGLVFCDPTPPMALQIRSFVASFDVMRCSR